MDDQINVYVHTSGVHSFNQEIAGSYVVEYIKDGIPYTYPPEGKSTMLYAERATPERVTINLLTRAVAVIRQYLDKAKDIKSVTVYLDLIASRAFINNWPKRWEAEGYMSARHIEVKNREAWERYNEYMHKLDDVNICFTTLADSYQTLMIKQAQEEVKRHKAAK